MDSNVDDNPFEWWHSEPGRLDADQQAVGREFPGLVWSSADNGQWLGYLPLWPFERAAPAGLAELLDGCGLEVVVRCGQAYPAAPPRVFPVSPEPEFLARTQSRWHVNGDGSLCLFRDEAKWTTRVGLRDVLLKACGWRIEYALMKAGCIDAMTTNGIVHDPVLDPVIGARPAAHGGLDG
jgi:hypothetical protein